MLKLVSNLSASLSFYTLLIATPWIFLVHKTETLCCLECVGLCDWNKLEAYRTCKKLKQSSKWKVVKNNIDIGGEEVIYMGLWEG